MLEETAQDYSFLRIVWEITFAALYLSLRIDRYLVRVNEAIYRQLTHVLLFNPRLR